MEQHIIGWLIRYGSPLLFLAQALGIVGLPIPDELLLTASGALVRQGTLRASSATSAAVAGCLCGITVSYLVGREACLPMLRKRLHIGEGAIARAERWSERFGVWLLAFGFFIPGVRHVTAILAGSTGISYPTFARYAYVGGTFWCSVFLTLGYVAGDRWAEVGTYARSHLTIALSLVAGCAAAYLIIRSLVRPGQPPPGQ
jgi:membrane protein DedA with SNARE-associated domain